MFRTLILKIFFLLGCFHFGEQADTFFGVSISIYDMEKSRVIF